MMEETHIMNEIKEACCFVSEDFAADLETCRCVKSIPLWPHLPECPCLTHCPRLLAPFCRIPRMLSLRGLLPQLNSMSPYSARPTAKEVQRTPVSLKRRRMRHTPAREPYCSQHKVSQHCAFGRTKGHLCSE